MVNLSAHHERGILALCSCAPTRRTADAIYVPDERRALICGTKSSKRSGALECVAVNASFWRMGGTCGLETKSRHRRPQRVWKGFFEGTLAAVRDARSGEARGRGAAGAGRMWLGRRRINGDARMSLLINHIWSIAIASALAEIAILSIVHRLAPRWSPLATAIESEY